MPLPVPNEGCNLLVGTRKKEKGGLRDWRRDVSVF